MQYPVQTRERTQQQPQQQQQQRAGWACFGRQNMTLWRTSNFRANDRLQNHFTGEGQAQA
eukprot:21373-Heterococcus_DN1.PRE.1